MAPRRFVWYSDTHINMSLLPFLKRLYVLRLEWLAADGLFITGDISSGRWLESDLRFLARHFRGPIYFVLGNHDYHGRHIQSVHADVRRICQEHPNLHWMEDNPVVSLSEEVALVGADGWYDAELGDPRWLRWTTDWFLTFDFLHLPGMEARRQEWRRMAEASAEAIEGRLAAALEDHKTVYVLTHVPPWPEAAVASAGPLDRLWLPYNTNGPMGRAIERVTAGRKKKRVIVLAGHTHVPVSVRVRNNVECRVARASYFGRIRREQTIIV